MPDFSDFLLSEYENIAKAHFEAQKQFAVFFRYYILFASVPILILTAVGKDNEIFKNNVFGYILLFLGFVGFFFYLFVINLKNEAVLYSRTVNGIRKYFYDNMPNPQLATSIRVLPTDIKKPKYFNATNPVLIIMIILNTLFIDLGLYYGNQGSAILLIIVSSLILGGHILSNFMISSIHERRYP